MKSFSSLVKEEISKIQDKQKLCCAFAALYGMLICGNREEGGKVTFSTSVENALAFKACCEFICQKKKIDFSVDGRKVSVATDVIKFFTFAEIEKIFKCKNCIGNFFKGVFLFYGSLSDPEKMYRLDLSFNDNSIATELQNSLNDTLGLNFKCTTRKEKFVLYTKDNETIADFLGLIGANNFAYDVINSKIEKEIRNEANRVTNCDSANINKSISASQKYCDTITKLNEEGYFDDLPDLLKEMAQKRMDMPSLNLAELGRQFNPPLSKSCVHHRLEKIIQFYDRVKNK